MTTKAARKTERLEAETNVYKAMAHPVRHELFRILNDRVASPNELTNELGLPLSDVAYHVRALFKLDCIELVDTRPVRGATEHFYRATRRSLVDTEDWNSLPPASKGMLTDGFIQPMVDDYTISREAGIVGSDEHWHLTRTPITVDTAGRERVLEIIEEARLAILEEQASSVARMIESGETPTPMSSSHACFEMPAKTG